MADFGLFIGFGAPARGREVAATKVFEEAMTYLGGLQKAGEIESVEVGILEPHGGDLGGFMLVRGDREQVAQVRGSAEFELLVVRAGFAVENLGVTAVYLGEEAARYVMQANTLTADLA